MLNSGAIFIEGPGIVCTLRRDINIPLLVTHNALDNFLDATPLNLFFCVPSLFHLIFCLPYITIMVLSCSPKKMSYITMSLLTSSSIIPGTAVTPPSSFSTPLNLVECWPSIYPELQFVFVSVKSLISSKELPKPSYMLEKHCIYYTFYHFAPLIISGKSSYWNNSTNLTNASIVGVQVLRIWVLEGLL